MFSFNHMQSSTTPCKLWFLGLKVINVNSHDCFVINVNFLTQWQIYLSNNATLSVIENVSQPWNLNVLLMTPKTDRMKMTIACMHEIANNSTALNT